MDEEDPPSASLNGSRLQGSTVPKMRASPSGGRGVSGQESVDLKLGTSGRGNICPLLIYPLQVARWVGAAADAPVGRLMSLS